MRIERRVASYEKIPQQGRRPQEKSERNISHLTVLGLCVLALSCGSEEPSMVEIPSATGGSPIDGSLQVGGSISDGVGGVAPVSGSGGTSPVGGGGNTGDDKGFILTSPAFKEVDGCSVENPSVCEVFPDMNVSYMENANLSPELHWQGAPPGTKSFALVLLDVTYGQAHWALWNIPGESTMLPGDIPQASQTPERPEGSQQATANFATTGGYGYFGPHVPCNVFKFELYALSSETFSPSRSESSVLVSIELAELGDEEVLGRATLTGRSNDYMTLCE